MKNITKKQSSTAFKSQSPFEEFSSPASDFLTTDVPSVPARLERSAAQMLADLKHVSASDVLVNGVADVHAPIRTKEDFAGQALAMTACVPTLTELGPAFKMTFVRLADQAEASFFFPVNEWNLKYAKHFLAGGSPIVDCTLVQLKPKQPGFNGAWIVSHYRG